MKTIPFSIFLVLTFIFSKAFDNVPLCVFPHNFLWGTAVSEYQISGALGCPHSNWAAFETIAPKNGKPPIADGQCSGSACDFKNNYPTYIALMKELGTNAFRFSVEWSNIEPQEGVFCQEELQFYDDFCQALLDAGITPMITLHHFTDPLWFTQKGGFEKEENILYFVRFCKKVFERLSTKVSLWVTFNEPNIYVFQGYDRGVFPPGKKSRSAAVCVLRNLLKAHVITYKTLKAMPKGNTAHIGIVHQYLKFYPYSAWNPLERVPGILFNDLLNTYIFKFLKSGLFKVKVSPLCEYEYQAPRNHKLYDFIGLNYYSRVIVKWQPSLTEPLVPSCYPGEIMTDMPYAIYAQGLYDAIAHMSEFNVPIYITENGIADAHDNRRAQFIKEYIAVLERAIHNGYDVRGYFYWSLMDNFEWDEGYHKKFGLCHVDFETKKATLRQGAQAYKAIIKNSI
jgi:beta-glucosidase